MARSGPQQEHHSLSRRYIFIIFCDAVRFLVSCTGAFNMRLPLGALLKVANYCEPRRLAIIIIKILLNFISFCSSLTP